MRYIPAALLLALPAAAEEWAPQDWQAQGVEVDVELVLAVDVSRSISPEELMIQRLGYAEALTSPEVLAAIGDGLLGRIAITYIEWAGARAQRTVIDWTVIETSAEAQRFADEILGNTLGTMRRTSISGALEYAAGSFEGNGFDGLRRVIDISGDGPNNDGPPVTEVRDAVVARGITINGLPLMTNTGGGFQELPDLDIYFRDCVIGGPMAFVIPVTGWDQFADAVRRKLVLELAGLPPADPPDAFDGVPVIPASTGGGSDCLIGERMWNRGAPF
jgi:hypothetical protein